MSTVRPGSTAERDHVVTTGDTALALGSGDVPVLATPRLVAWLEAACVAAVTDALGDGETSVGRRITIDHLRASPVGAHVRVRARLVDADDRTLEFELEAGESGRQVARGQATRRVVGRAWFLDRLRQRL